MTKNVMINLKKKLLHNIRKLCQKTNFSMNKMYIKIKTILLSVHKCVTFPEFCICIKNDPLLFYFNLFLIMYVVNNVTVI